MTRFGTARNIMAISALGAGMSLAGCECGEGQGVLSRLTPAAEIQPDTIEFGSVPVGATLSLPVDVKNSGAATLAVCLAQEPALPGSAEAGCDVPSGFEPLDMPYSWTFENTTDSGNWLVERGETRQFYVNFTPPAQGDFSAVLHVMHTGSNGPVTPIVITGNGVAPQIDFSQTVFDFGDVPVGQRREIQLVLSNRTMFGQPVTIKAFQQSSITFGMATASAGDLPNGQDLTAEVPGNSDLTITFWYTPQDEAAHTNSTTAVICAGCDPVGLTVQGRGIKPAFELDPNRIDFGNVDEGTASTKSFVARNIGMTPITIFEVGLDLGTTTEFSAAPEAGITLPRSINPQETVKFEVTYTGVTPGRDTGRIYVRADAWDDPNTPNDERTLWVDVQATSTGPDIDPLPPAVNFGTLAIGGVAGTRMLQLQNVGNADLTITQIQMDAAHSPEFGMTNLPALPVTLTPGNVAQLTVTYGPADAGLDITSITIDSNDRNEPMLVVPVQGVGGVPTTCSLTVAPTQVTFGLVERGRSVDLPVEIRNGGAQPCTVSNIQLNGGTEFTIMSGQTPAGPIGPGTSHRVFVTYAPTQYGSHATQLEFDSDDPSNMHMTVPINGASAMSAIRVIPSDLNFNVVPVTCRSPNRAITVYNTGATQVTITAVYLDSSTTPEFELQPFSAPQNVPAGGSAVINVRYHPADIGVDTGVLFIEHTAAAGSRVAVPLRGDGQLNPTVTDTFQQLPTPQADVLFIVDNSCSMSEEQSSLGRNLGSFLAYAQQEGIDYQIGISTTDTTARGAAGRFIRQPAYSNLPIITPMTPNATAMFQAYVNQGTGGSGNETGLEAAYLALSDPIINNENAGFVRPNAALAVIMVSDEEDYSRRPVSFYENFLRNIKGFQNSAMFSFSAIVGITQPRCTGAGGNADYGGRYIQVAQATGGVVESICSANWGQTLANIGLNSFGLKRQFVLSSTPVPSTIRVEVDAVPVPSVTPGGTQRWTYEQASNSVMFQTGSVPQANATITVTYTVACLP